MNVRASVAKLNSLCSRCGHSEFVHSDRQAHSCLFKRCTCRLLYPMHELLIREPATHGVPNF